MKALEKKTTNSRAICNSVLFKSYKAGGFGFLPFLFAENGVTEYVQIWKKGKNASGRPWVAR